MIRYDLLATLGHFSRDERIRLALNAKQADKLEREWKRKFDEQIDALDDMVFRHLVETDGWLPAYMVDFLPIVLEHSYRVMAAGLASAEEQLSTDDRLSLCSPDYRFAARPPGGPRIPRSLANLKDLYDQWKRKRNLPPRQKAIADKLRKAYLKRIQSVWERHGRDFREGRVYDRQKVKEVLRFEGDMAKSRAGTIVQTETTYFFQKARRAVYDRSPDVTHYMFIALRDQATTKWCRSRQGVVFKKGSDLLERNQPPCHWNCRSEMVPLTKQNPKHRKLIEDKSRRAENVRMEPLPAGWGRR